MKNQTISNAQLGLGKSLKAMLASATNPGNILIDVVLDNELSKLSGLRLNDSIVIDRGDVKPHSGGDYYLIRFDGIEVVRQIMLTPNGWQVANDHGKDMYVGDEFSVIGRILGSVQVRTIH